LENPVTAVLLAFRAWDTLLEKVVVVLALVGVWSFAPDSFWGGRPGVRYLRDPAVIFLAQILCPVGIVVGVYLFWVGASAPGGAFQCATIFAAMWVLVTMAGLTDPPPVGRMWVRVAAVAGALVFAGIGAAGFFTAGAFLAYPVDFAKPLILLIEAALTLSVAFTLGLLVAGAPTRREEK
jgi:multisubunit Na+/H+ antiporter MnhB subunit